VPGNTAIKCAVLQDKTVLSGSSRAHSSEILLYRVAAKKDCLAGSLAEKGLPSCKLYNKTTKEIPYFCPLQSNGKTEPDRNSSAVPEAV
jgi:hypothetical protein